MTVFLNGSLLSSVMKLSFTWKPMTAFLWRASRVVKASVVANG